MVTSLGWNAREWKYLGLELSGRQTYRAKLVKLGLVRNREEASERANKMGYRLVEGQAIGPFRARFSQPDGKGPIVFGGCEWQNQHGEANVICLIGFMYEWNSDFRYSGGDFFGDSRWLVVAKEPSSPSGT